MARRPKRKAGELSDWSAYRMRGSRSVLLGTVRAADEAGAIKAAVEKYGIPEALRDRIVVRPSE